MKWNKPGALRFEGWPQSDQAQWAQACRPSVRLKRGGAAAHLAPVSQRDIANRYGLFLDFVVRHGHFDPTAGPAELVTPAHVNGFVAELKQRVRSVTLWNSVYKLRRAAQLLAPDQDWRWLIEIEKDTAFMMEPRDKAERLVLTNVLVQAGLTLVNEAVMFAKTPLQRAMRVRDGLVIALLALHPLRIKNFATLQLNESIQKIGENWWLIIKVRETKTHRMDERRIPPFMTAIIDEYVGRHRPILMGKARTHDAFWVSSTTGGQFTVKNLGTLISKITRQTVGVDVSPHLFRTAAASTAALYSTKDVLLGPGILAHRDERVTEEHYLLSSSLHAGHELATVIGSYRIGSKSA